MAHCPNCGRKLHLTDWRPECPGCHINLNYFNANQRLLEDSERAEIEHAKFQPKVDRAKAAYAGSKLAIVRIVLSVLPIGALFLPLANVDGKNFNVLNVYKHLSSAGFGSIFSGIAAGDTAYAAILGLLVSAVMLLVCLIAIIASLGKRGKLRSAILYGILFVSALSSLICLLLSAHAPRIGAYVYFVLVVALVGWNILLGIKGIPVRYTPCLIGGLPSAEYFAMVESGMTLPQIRRKMLVALAELQEAEEAKRKNEEEKEAATVCPQ